MEFGIWSVSAESSKYFCSKTEELLEIAAIMISA